MRVEVAKAAGVCYGVERALKLAEEATAREGQVHSLGPIIHNPQAVEYLRQRGLEVADSLDQVEGGTLVIRTHGVPAEIIAAATERGLVVEDATCPYVKKVHRAVESLAAEGYLVVIVGESDHPEVIGIRTRAGENALVIERADELPEQIAGRKVGVVVQTTQTEGTLNEVILSLLPRVNELRIFNTICDATTQRQDAAYDLAGRVDVMVVVGGHNSGNTNRLAEICTGVNPRTHLVETAAELDESWFAGAELVGVTAGASTPDAQIREVISVIEAIH